jgi:signal transduction histidine kinase
MSFVYLTSLSLYWERTPAFNGVSGMAHPSTLSPIGPSTDVTQLFAKISSPRRACEVRKTPISMDIVDVRSVVEKVIECSRSLIAKHGHELLVSLPDAPLHVTGDPAKLESVVMHLLDNAAKYSSDGGCIWVNLTREGDSAVLRVRDSGQGLSAKLLRHIFEFVLPAGLSTPKSGFGIGLPIAKGLVELHRGTLTAHSDGIGCGADFTVRLPALVASDK